MKRKHFGTDGIRGRVGVAPITADFVLRLANAVGRVLRAAKTDGVNGKNPLVIIGKDTRISGYMLESALESGFSSAGVDVYLLGPIPTPGVAYLTRAMRADLGVVISASHNPFEDNGIKFFSAQGEKLSDAWELAVEAELDKECLWVSSRALGKARRIDDARGRYSEFCKSIFPADLSLKGLRLVIDTAHGAAYQTAPAVFTELGAEISVIGNQPDGLNINEGVGATHPEALRAAVQTQGADYGIALDGDADRLLMADGTGRIFNGDELLFVLAKERLATGERVGGVVGTLMTNMGVEVALRESGIELVRAAVGDRYILETLTQRQWLLGGESSGHLLALDKHSTGDGTMAALLVLQAVVRSGQSLSQLLQGVRLYPQVMIGVDLTPQSPDWQEHEPLQRAIPAVQAQLGDTGRILIRKSGTEPLLRIMVEAADAALAQQCAQTLAQAFMS